MILHNRKPLCTRRLGVDHRGCKWEGVRWVGSIAQPTGFGAKPRKRKYRTCPRAVIVLASPPARWQDEVTDYSPLGASVTGTRALRAQIGSGPLGRDDVMLLWRKVICVVCFRRAGAPASATKGSVSRRCWIRRHQKTSERDHNTAALSSPSPASEGLSESDGGSQRDRAIAACHQACSSGGVVGPFASHGASYRVGQR